MDVLANLKAFLASADTGSFSQAARRSAVVPSVVAKRIDQLEWRIQAKLFTRSTRKLTLTDVGERYLPIVRTLVQQLDDTLAGMNSASGDIEGHIKIKIPSTLGTLYLSDLLRQFLLEQPRISMEVVLADRSVNPSEEGFDMALGALPELYGGVKDFALCPIERQLCAAPAYLAARGTPRELSELVGHDCLVFATSGARWEFQSKQGIVGVDVRPKLKTNDGAALYRATTEGLGIAVLAHYLAQPALATGALVQVLPQLHIPDIWLKALVPANRIDVPRIHILLQWLTLRLTAIAPLTLK